MKRYFLFAYPDYYPMGGMADFVKDYSILKDAKTKGEKLIGKIDETVEFVKWGSHNTWNRYQVYDCKLRKIVATNDDDIKKKKG